MKKPILAFFIMAMPVVLRAQEASTDTARGITLPEAYRLSLAKSETLAQSVEGVQGLEAAEHQIRSLFFPSLNGFATESAAEKSKGTGQAGISVNYALFSGMRDYITARSSNLKTNAAKLDLARAKQALYLNVVQAYINLTTVRQEIKVRTDQLAISDNLIKELQDRESVGRSRKGEVVAAQAQRAQDNSALQDAKGREDFAQVQLGFLTGLDEDLAPELLPVSEHQSRASYFLRAQNRFDVEAARKTLEAAQLDADVQEHLRWPTVSAEGDYYATRSEPNQDIKWDAGVNLSLPLYTGGFISASVDQAKANARSAELGLALVIRQAHSDVKGAFSVLHHSVDTLNSLRDAVGLAKENVNIQNRDYVRTLVTNLDVLTAQNTLLQSRLGAEQARAQATLAGFQLEVAAGGPESITEEK